MIPLHDDNPTTIRPIVTIALIVACVLVFLWEVSLGPVGAESAIRVLGVTPAALFGSSEALDRFLPVPAWMTLVTSMFLHGGWMHLIGNLLYLWIFGNNVEDSMGHRRFITFYLLCGVAAALAHALPASESVAPMIGASGAISGVLGAYLLLFPHARVLTLIPLGFFITHARIKAGWLLLFWFVWQVLASASTATPEGGGVAWGAHIGGFIAGMALIPFFKHPHVRLFAPGRVS